MRINIGRLFWRRSAGHTRTRCNGARKPSGGAFGVAFECVRASALGYCESEPSSFVLATMPK